jgi:hypothetical protein
MRRIHAFEFNDMSACPAFIRDSIIETLGEGLRGAGVYEAVTDTYLEFVEASGAGTVLDLGSGSGHPAAGLVEACINRGARPPKMVLTDLFPNESALAAATEDHPETLDFEPTPVDATHIPEHLNHPACSIICAFHHFPPELAQAIISEQVKNNRAVFIMEGMPRQPWRVDPMLTTLLPAYFANPFRTRHDRLWKFLVTYPVPLAGLFGAWDGFISALRSYDESEYRAMAEQAGGDYRWTYREIPFGGGNRAVVFYGVPKSLG